MIRYVPLDGRVVPLRAQSLSVLRAGFYHPARDAPETTRTGTRGTTRTATQHAAHREIKPFAFKFMYAGTLRSEWLHRMLGSDSSLARRERSAYSSFTASFAPCCSSSCFILASPHQPCCVSTSLPSLKNLPARESRVQIHQRGRAKQ